MPSNGPKGLQTPFLGDFDAFLVSLGGGCEAFFGTFGSHNTAKSGQNGHIWTIKCFPKAPSAAGQCWQSAFLAQKCTLSACVTDYFLLVPGGRVAFHRRIATTTCFGCIVSRQTVLARCGVLHSLAMAC